MNLQNMIQRQVGIEQAKKEANKVGSVTANDVINLATTSDRLLRESINTAFKNAQEFPTSENLNKQIQDLSNFKEQAMLPATRIAFDMGIKNLQDYKLMQETRTKKGMELFTNARNLDTSDLESITTFRKEADSAFANQLIGDKQYEAIIDITEPKYKEADSQLDYAKEFGALKRFDEVFEKGGAKAVDELIYQTFTETGDESTLTRLVPFAKNYMENVKARVEAFEKDQENVQEMTVLNIVQRAKDIYGNIVENVQGDASGDPITGRRTHANLYNNTYVLDNVTSKSFGEKYFMKGYGIDAFDFDSWYDDALTTMKSILIIDESLPISKTLQGRDNKNMENLMDKSNPMHFSLIRDTLNQALTQIAEKKEDGTFFSDKKNFSYEPLETTFKNLLDAVNLYENNRKAFDGVRPTKTNADPSFMDLNLQLDFLDKDN